jgi:hypothetical protein
LARILAHPRYKLAQPFRPARRNYQSTASRIVDGVALVMTADWKKIAADAWGAPSWREAAEQYHRVRAGRPLIAKPEPEHLKRLRRLMRPSVTLEQAWNEINDPRNRPTPEVVVEAIMIAVRERGLAALKEPATAERLERCDAAAKAEIERRIAKLRKD